MQLPFFYQPALSEDRELILSEENSRHLSQVLRMNPDEKIHLTDGLGSLATATIKIPDKKKTIAFIYQHEKFSRSLPETTIAICPVKNPQRFEWFLAKAVEIGVSAVIPLFSERTERTFLKKERMEKIIISSMIQSRQVWKTHLARQIKFEEFIRKATDDNKFIAHCLESEKINLIRLKGNSTILIGPEGDFTGQEISEAINLGYQPVSLGTTRLRTETAGIVAAVLLKFLGSN